MSQPAGFTTRPEISGHFGVVTSTHWLASQVAMGVLERGGNAFDAACAGGFLLQVAEPHLNGPGGDVPILLWNQAERRAEVICGQGPAPAAATLEHFRELGLDLVPGTGLLPAVVPGAFDAWMLLLRDHGTLSPRDVLEPAIAYARQGVPVLPRMAATLAAIEPIFRRDWPSSAAVYLADGLPPTGGLLRNAALGDCFERLLQEAGDGSRESRIDAVRRAWSQGFVAAAIDDFCRASAVPDISGRPHRGLLRGEDMAGWQATVEAPMSLPFAGCEVLKCGPWSQGPVLLQCLGMLAGEAWDDLPSSGPDFVHLLTEVIKLAYADRETFYGDPDLVTVPLDRLLASDYAAQRRAQVGPSASDTFRPGELPGFGKAPDFAAACGRVKQAGILAAYGGGEPTMQQHGPEALVGDTCYLAVADRFGNLVSATPSGGWLQSSPVIPALGFCLGTRGQTFWLDADSPNGLAPGKRPRTTLTPTLVLRDGEGYLACGTPGGDQQDQWQLQFLLRHLCQGLDLQSAIEAPAFHVEQWPGSFYPRAATPQRLVLEERFPAETIEALRGRGHAVDLAAPWSEGRMGACSRVGSRLFAAASPRGVQAYAVGR